MPANRYKAYRVWMWPFWLLALLTTAKSFRDNPVIGARALNKCGLHIVRVMLARAITWWRWLLLMPLMDRDMRTRFHHDGFVTVPAFIDAATVSAIRAEIKNHKGEVRCMTQGNTATQRILLDGDALADKPVLTRLCSAGRFIGPLRYSAASLTMPLLYIQRIRNGYPGDYHSDHIRTQDPQKTMHADTFHPTMKAWLFLEDVTPTMGPFTYVRGSHRLTVQRIKWEYARSCTAAQNPDGYSEKGSFRAMPEDLHTMNLPAPTGVCVKAGTLVIANTNGFHGRGQAEDGASRLEVWAYSRPNPFNPIPGLPFRFVAALQARVLYAHWRRKDRTATARGSRASWHLVNSADMTDFDV